MVSLAVPALIAGCAQEKTTSTGEQAREYLELLMSTEYPGIQPDKWGIYILKDTPGTGVEWSPEAVYSKLRSTVRSIDGTVLTSTEADIAKQLDENDYKPYNYYGPKYQNTSNGTGNAGLEYLLGGMRVGPNGSHDGIYISVKHLSDGSIQADKVIKPANSNQRF